MNGGLYTYTVPSPAPCPAATAEVFVVIEQPVDAGTDGAIVLCSTNGPASLFAQLGGCLLYTSDAADERSSVDLGGRRIITKKTTKKQKKKNHHIKNKTDKNK